MVAELKVIIARWGDAMKNLIVFLFLVTALLLSPVSNAQKAPGPNVPVFKTEAAAKKHCPSDVVVWLDTKTGAYHFKAQRWYGHTKYGAYVCEKESHRPGARVPKTGNKSAS